MRVGSARGMLLRAAELLAGPWRMRINAATMHGQSKTCHQAEIDAACEMIDFFRFNATFAQQLYQMQPKSAPGMWNMSELRPLEGFVFALTPFNFTAIGGNLPTAPALMGNTVVWKPAESQLLTAWRTFELLEEAGFPPGVINFIPGLGHQHTNLLLDHPDFAGLHFTGSTDVFNMMWKRVGDNLGKYKSYPRLVGETGGKDFILAHASADPKALATAIIRGGFEYQGQKCSAASRVYVAQSVWAKMKDELVSEIGTIKMGDVSDFTNFMGAVIKKGAFDKHAAAIAEARETRGMKVLAGGTCDDKEGWFVQPTLLQTEDPSVRHMRDEFFGPIVTLHVYPDRRVGRHAAARRPHVAVRAHRCGVRARPRGDRRGDERAARRRRQLLHQRQADRRRRRPAAVRRRARVGHRRQGRLAAQPPALDCRANDQRDVRAADRLSVCIPQRTLNECGRGGWSWQRGAMLVRAWRGVAGCGWERRHRRAARRIRAGGWVPPIEMGLSSDGGDDDPRSPKTCSRSTGAVKRSGGMGSEDIWVAKRTSVNTTVGYASPVTQLNSSRRRRR